ncbi:UNVERIFIED_CONTAM: hypothetical protein FKN15_044341 [Acipenser sinensis]
MAWRISDTCTLLPSISLTDRLSPGVPTDIYIQLLTAVIALEKSLHEPMYIFICSLSVNEMFGSSVFFPKLLNYSLARIRTVSYIDSLFQMFCLHSYASVQFAILAVMAYGRYESICNPLLYHSTMTPCMVLKLLLMACLLPTSIVLVVVILHLRLPLCGFVLESFYCENLSLRNLSCVDTTINEIYGLVTIGTNIGIPVLLILYSYGKVFLVFLSLESLIIHPIASPFIYGVKTQAIRKRIVMFFKGKKGNLEK